MGGAFDVAHAYTSNAHFDRQHTHFLSKFLSKSIKIHFLDASLIFSCIDGKDMPHTLLLLVEQQVLEPGATLKHGWTGGQIFS